MTLRKLYGDANACFTEETEEHAAEHGHLVVDDGGTVRFQTTGELQRTGVPQSEETGAAVDPSGPPPEGQRAEHEEVGTPEAPAAG
jgi:hypothetical protein